MPKVEPNPLSDHSDLLRTVSPHPSISTEALAREVACLREVLALQTAEQRNIMDSELRAATSEHVRLREAIKAQAENFDSKLMARTTAMNELREEKFNGIQRQFLERNIRNEVHERATKEATALALTSTRDTFAEQNRASEMAISKSETATAKQIDQLHTMTASISKATDDRIDDLKSRITRLESEGLGAKSNQSEYRAGTSSTVSVISLVVGIIVGLAGVITVIINNATHIH